MIRYSKILHTILLCGFLLPFFYTGCEAVTSEESEVAAIDTVEVIDTDSSVNQLDSSLRNEVFNVDPPQKEEVLNKINSTDTISESEEDRSPTEKIVKRVPFLKYVLTPRTETYSGLGAVINSLAFLAFYSITVSFFLLILSLVLKWIEPKAIRSIAILETLALVLFFIAESPSWNSDKLFGYWIVLILLVTLSVLDVSALISTWKSIKKIDSIKKQLKG